MSREWTLARRDHLLALLLFVFAFLVRLYWVHEVQPPHESVFSDMAAYLHRARVVLGYSRFAPGHEHEMVVFPWGVHTWYATLLYLLGPDGWATSQTRAGWVGAPLWSMAWVHAAVGALPVVFVYLTSLEIVRRRTLAVAFGLAAALWPQSIVFCGYFSSEIPFAACVAASTWCLVRAVRTDRGWWAVGLTMAVGMTLRPQLLLTAGLASVWLAWISVTRGFGIRRWVGLWLPIVLVLAFSAVRFHHYTGRFGTVSANGELARLMAVSDYKRVRTKAGRGFVPPARSKEQGFSGSFEFEGKITDEEPLREERKRIWNGMTWRERSRVLQRNVGFLITRNDLWPERNAVRYARSGGHPDPEQNLWRVDSISLYNELLNGVVPLVWVGVMVGLARRGTAARVVAMQLGTMVFVAAFFFGELRYRVPYDPVLLLGMACLYTPRRRAGVFSLLTVIAVALLGAWYLQTW